MEKKEIFGGERGAIIALSANRITEEFAGIDTAVPFISSLYHIAFCLENRVKKILYVKGKSRKETRMHYEHLCTVVSKLTKDIDIPVERVKFLEKGDERINAWFVVKTTKKEGLKTLFFIK